MSTIPDEAPPLNEEVWRAWLAKRTLMEEAAARTCRVTGGVILAMLALGYAIYGLAL